MLIAGSFSAFFTVVTILLLGSALNHYYPPLDAVGVLQTAALVIMVYLLFACALLIYGKIFKGYLLFIVMGVAIWFATIFVTVLSSNPAPLRHTRQIIQNIRPQHQLLTVTEYSKSLSDGRHRGWIYLV